METIVFDYRLKGQRGAALIVALVLLLVLTVLGTAGIRDTTMEERMAGNFRDESVALEAAELMLRHAEARLGAGELTSFVSAGTDGLYEIVTSDEARIPGDTGVFAGELPGDDNDVFDYGEDDRLVNSLPSYYIERLPKTGHRGDSVVEPKLNDDVQFYRVTARGAGVSPNSEVILQSTYYVE